MKNKSLLNHTIATLYQRLFIQLIYTFMRFLINPIISVQFIFSRVELFYGTSKSSIAMAMFEDINDNFKTPSRSTF